MGNHDGRAGTLAGGFAGVSAGDDTGGEPVLLQPVRATVPRWHVPATLTRERIGGVLVLHLRGEIDLLGAAGLGAELTRQLRCSPEALVVDLAAVTFLSLSGLSTLFDAQRSAATAGIPLRLARPSRPVRRALELSGLASQFDVHDDLPAATCARSTS